MQPVETAVAARQVTHAAENSAAIRVQGKFFFTGATKFFVKGVTYGPFPVGEDGEKDAVTKSYVKKACESIYKQLVRQKIAVDKRRPDGRSETQIRQIEVEVSVMPRTHGSGLFTRGQTQIMSLLTLGTAKEGQRIDDLSLERDRRFMHHYNFPPYSVGETGRMGSPKRRDIGHGATRNLDRELAARSIGDRAPAAGRHRRPGGRARDPGEPRCRRDDRARLARRAARQPARTPRARDAVTARRCDRDRRPHPGRVPAARAGPAAGPERSASHRRGAPAHICCGSRGTRPPR